MMRPQVRAFMFLTITVLAITVAPAYSATITTYTDPTAWQNAATVLQTITFAGLAPADSSTTYNGSTGVTTGNAEFIGYTSSGSSWIQVIDTDFSSYFDFGSGGDALAQSMNRPNSSSPLPSIQVVLPTGVTALGFDLFTVSPSALSFTVTVAGTNYTVPTDSNPTLAFWGITSDTPITSIALTAAGSTYNGSTSVLMENFQYGTADLSQAPEAATFLLIGSGLIGLAIVKKWISAKRPA
jgi:hypothetical protein